MLGQGRTRALAASLVNANELLIRARAVFDRLVAVWWDDLAGVAWRLYPSEGVHVPGPTFGHIDVDLKSQIRQAVRAAVDSHDLKTEFITARHGGRKLGSYCTLRASAVVLASN